MLICNGRCIVIYLPAVLWILCVDIYFTGNKMLHYLKNIIFKDSILNYFKVLFSSENEVWILKTYPISFVCVRGKWPLSVVLLSVGKWNIGHSSLCVMLESNRNICMQTQAEINWNVGVCILPNWQFNKTF